MAGTTIALRQIDRHGQMRTAATLLRLRSRASARRVRRFRYRLRHADGNFLGADQSESPSQGMAASFSAKMGTARSGGWAIAG